MKLARVELTSEEKARSKTLADCKKALLKKREEVLKLKTSLEKSYREFICETDMNESDPSINITTADQLHTLKRPAQLSGVLKAIDFALARIARNDPKFGICEGCGEFISVARLAVVPWAKMCVPCKDEDERSKHPHNHGGGIQRDFAPPMRVA